MATRSLRLSSTALALAGGLLLLLFLLTSSVGRAQDSGPIEFPENSTDPVATFTAEDPEGATPIAWHIATATQVGAVASLADADNADAASFMIDKDGALKFINPPDFENPPDTNATDNTYKVAVVACDVALEGSPAACPDTGKAGYHKVTVKVTKVDEPGKVTLATNTGDGTPQYLVGATLTATASDGDIKHTTAAPDQDFTDDVEDQVTGVVWRWYRGSTEISGATNNRYTLKADDAGQHIRAVVFYVVEGNVDQEEASVTTEHTVLGGRVGANLLKFPAAVSRSIMEGDKGRPVGDPVTATGYHGIVEYSIVAQSDNALSTDDIRFKIDKKTGQISTNVVLDYESDAVASATAAGSCSNATSDTPDRTCVVVVTARDSTGEAPTTEATVTITLTDVDEAPTFSTGAKAVTVLESSTDLYGAVADGYSGATDAAGVTYTAEDPEGRIVSYSLAGPDASKFQLDSRPPILSFASKPDFEAKASADGDNVYEVTVLATAGGKTGERAVRVTVRGVDEGPEISGPSTRSFVENSKDPVATYTAEDPEGVTPIAWYVLASDAATGDIAGVGDNDRVDGVHFTIDKDGVLKFSSPPDFENPSGEDGTTSNTYKVVVVACDVALDGTGVCPSTGNAGYHKVTVTVTKVDEQGKVELSSSNGDNPTEQYLIGATDRTPAAAVELTATASDGDIKHTTAAPDQDFTDDVDDQVTGVTWRWFRGGAQIEGATSNTYTLVDADENQRIRVEVRYLVDGNTQRETASLTTEPVLKGREGANALKFDPARVSMSISEGDKGRNVGAPVTATGNHGAVRYTLDTSSLDASRFEIDEKTGQIKTAVALDYEGGDAPASAGPPVVAGSCSGATGGTPDRECTVTVIATDSTGDSTDDAGTNLVVTINITNEDESPTFSTGAKAVTVPEGNTGLFGTTDDGYSGATDVAGVTYTAADPEGRTVAYSLAGPDMSKFKLSASETATVGPVLSFVSKPDFEAKASADGDNIYEVTVRATADGKTGERAVRVTVGNVDEAPTIVQGGLLISGSASEDVPENSTDVATYTLIGPNKDTATWSKSGDDASHFSISSGGVLTFASAPNFEAPASMDGDNVYEVTLTATDSENNSDTQDVTVTVTDVAEAGTVALSSAPYLVGEVVTATLMDPDQNVTGATWQWSRGDMADGSDAADIAGATSDSYTMVTDDDTKYLTATVTYTDDAGDDSAKATTSEAVTSNRAPEFDATDNTRVVDENSAAGTAVGMPVVATDADGDTLIYTLTGTDAAAFEIDRGTGQISVGQGTMLDYETGTTSYTVTVTATDPHNRMATIDVTINVTDVDEDPSITSTSAAVTAITHEENATTALATYTASDPESEMLTWSLSGPDAGMFSISPAGVLTFDAAPDFEMPGDANGDNVYELTVATSDPAMNSDQLDVSVTVTNVGLPTPYDANDDGQIEKSEVITAIADYVSGGANAPTKQEVIRLIGLYFGD